MYLSDTWIESGRPTVRVTDATTYSAVEGVYADRPDPSSLWLSLESGRSVLSLRMTTAQLESLYQQLGALLTDRAVCSTTPEELDRIAAQRREPPEYQAPPTRSEDDGRLLDRLRSATPPPPTASACDAIDIDEGDPLSGSDPLRLPD